MPPLFSVVIPTHNRPEKLIRAVRSVLAQTFIDYEILVVDNGDVDVSGPLEVFEGRVTCLRSATPDVAVARNLGIANACGRYIALLDDDDRWYPGKLARVAATLSQFPDAGLIYTQLNYVDEAGVLLWKPNIRTVRGDGYRPLLNGNFIATSAVVVRKDCVDRVGGFDSSLVPCEDWDLWIRVARFHPVVGIPEPLTAYEYLAEGSLSTRPEKVLRGMENVVIKALTADPSLSASDRKSIQANLAYVRARILLRSVSEPAALAEFQRAMAIDSRHWRARIYAAVLGSSWIRRILPLRVRKALRLTGRQT
jgi:glycosyltransferase involved in cell wall biosynthesis